MSLCRKDCLARKAEIMRTKKLNEAIFMDSGNDPRSYEDIYNENSTCSIGPAEAQQLRDLAHQILAIIGDDCIEEPLKESKTRKKLRESSYVTVNDVVEAAKYILDNRDYDLIRDEDEDYSLREARSLLKNIVTGEDTEYVQSLIDDWERDGGGYDADTIVLNYLGLGDFPD